VIIVTPAPTVRCGAKRKMMRTEIAKRIFERAKPNSLRMSGSQANLLQAQFARMKWGKSSVQSLCYTTGPHQIAHKSGERCQSWADKTVSNYDSFTFEFLHQQPRTGRFHPAKSLGYERIRQSEETARDPLEKEPSARLQNPAHLRQGFPPVRLQVNGSKVENCIERRVIAL